MRKPRKMHEHHRVVHVHLRRRLQRRRFLRVFVRRCERVRNGGGRLQARRNVRQPAGRVQVRLRGRVHVGLDLEPLRGCERVRDGREVLGKRVVPQLLRRLQVTWISFFMLELLFSVAYYRFTNRCTCKPGFDWQFKKNKCVDIDECEENHQGSAVCKQLFGQYSKCENHVGSYKCLCEDPSDIISDLKCSKAKVECSPSNDCHENAVCSVTSSDGGYKCECKENFWGNGKVCYGIEDYCLLNDNNDEVNCSQFT